LEILSSDETELKSETREIDTTEMRSEKVDRRQNQTMDKSETVIVKGQRKSFDKLHNRRPTSSKAFILKLPSDKPKTLSDAKIIYLRRAGPGGRTITFPPGMDIPIRNTVSPLEHPVFIKCSVEGCANRKKYACSKTSAPLCSLACYKVNMETYEAQSITKDVVEDNEVSVVASIS